MAPKIDPNEIKVGIHVIGGTTEESGFGIGVMGGTKVGRSMGTISQYRYGWDEAGGGQWTCESG